MAKLHDSAYLVLTPEFWRYRPEDVRGFNISELRKRKPALRRGQVAVKVRLEIDASVFADYIPTVVAQIEGTDLLQPTVEVLTPEGEDDGTP